MCTFCEEKFTGAGMMIDYVRHRMSEHGYCLLHRFSDHDENCDKLLPRHVKNVHAGQTRKRRKGVDQGHIQIHEVRTARLAIVVNFPQAIQINIVKR